MSVTDHPGTTTRAIAGVVRHRLANGLRVVVAPGWPSERAVLAVHHGVGFRSEAPGQEGLAHVLEHLLFRGSRNHAPGRFFADLAGVAGEHGGTTHFDHTAYHQVVPVAALPAALDREADRAFDPLLDEAELREQLDGIAEEIRGAVHDVVLGDVPWPYLTGALFTDPASAHDGYGDPDAVRGFTVEDVRAFHAANYGPENTVVTVVGPVRADAVLAEVEGRFSALPARTRRPRGLPDAPGPGPGRAVGLTGTEPGLPFPVAACAVQAPDPVVDARGHLAHLVLAELLRAPDGRGEAGLHVLDARLGVFGVLDARGPDVLTVTARTERTDPDGVAAAFTAGWSALADTTGPAEVDRAARAVAARWERRHADLAERAGALGRTELLFGDPGTVEDLPRTVRTLSPAEVVGAARAVAAAPTATVVVTPAPGAASGARRRSAALRSVPVARSEPTAGAVRPARPRGLPTAVASSRAGRAQVDRVQFDRLAGDLRTAVVHDPRAEVAELRLRVPLGPGGWVVGAADLADGTAGLLQHGLRQAARAAGLAGEATARSDGQWLDVDVWTAQDQVGAWSDVLADTTGLAGGLWQAAGSGAVALRPRGPGSPLAVLDGELRRRSVGGDPPAALAHRPAGTTLVVVSARPLPPRELGSRLVRAWPSAPPTTSVGHPAGTFGVRTPAAGGPPPDDGPWLTLSGAEPGPEGGAAGPGDPARYLATGLLTAPGISRLAALQSSRGPAWWFAGGRDVLATAPRVLVRAHVPRGRVQTAVDDVTAVLEGLADEPPSPAEVAAVRAFCLDQATSLHDSPARLADAVRQAVAAGHGAQWVFDLPAAVAGVGHRAVVDAAATLFRPVTTALVVLG